MAEIVKPGRGKTPLLDNPLLQSQRKTSLKLSTPKSVISAAVNYTCVAITGLVTETLKGLVHLRISTFGRDGRKSGKTMPMTVRKGESQPSLAAAIAAAGGGEEDDEDDDDIDASPAPETHASLLMRQRSVAHVPVLTEKEAREAEEEAEDEEDFVLIRLVFYYLLPVVLAVFFVPWFALIFVVLYVCRAFDLLSMAGDVFGGGFSIANYAIRVDIKRHLLLGSLQRQGAGEEAKNAVRANVTAVPWASVTPKSYCHTLSTLLLRFSSVAYEFHGTEMDFYDGLSDEDNARIKRGELVQEKIEEWGFGVDKEVEGRISFEQEVGLGEAAFATLFWSEKHNFIVLAFQGTSPLSAAMILADAAVAPVLVGPARDNIRIHHGFYQAVFNPQHDDYTYQDIKRDILRAWQRINASSSSSSSRAKPTLWITGHSLGAAVATLFMYRLMGEWSLEGSANDTSLTGVLGGIPMADAVAGDLRLKDMFRCMGSYTVGQPRIGNEEFAVRFGQLKREVGAEQWRVQNANDIVTRAPPAGLYQHVGQKVVLHYPMYQGETKSGSLGRVINSAQQNPNKEGQKYPPRQPFQIGTFFIEDMRRWFGSACRAAKAGVLHWASLVGRGWLCQAMLYPLWWGAAQVMCLCFVADHLPPGYFFNLTEGTVDLRGGHLMCEGEEDDDVVVVEKEIRGGDEMKEKEDEEEKKEEKKEEEDEKKEEDEKEGDDDEGGQEEVEGEEEEEEEE